MARPKFVFSADLASRAQVDLETLDQHGTIQKLRAIVAASKFPISNVADVLGVASETIWRWAKAYDQEGLEGLYPKIRRAKPSKLTPEQKSKVLNWVDECKTPSGSAVHWTLERLRQAIIDQFGVTLGINTIWVWLRKENRKLTVPRPRHYKGSLKPKRLLKKLPELLQSRPGVHVFFFDEGRFGFQPVTARRWARKGIRPTVTVRPGYQNFYVYSAVNPGSGEEVSLFLPWVNTEMMNMYLAHLSQILGRRKCLLVMDQAGWHLSADLKIPWNIELAFLPPYSPGLNPVERLWQWLKRHALRNQCHESLGAIMDAVQNCLQAAPPSFFKSLCRCGYLLH